MSTCVFCEDSVLIVVTPVAWAWHCLLGPLYTTNLPKWRAGWSSGEQITSSLNGCTSLPASHHRTACIFSCSKSYMITPLSIYHPNSSLSGAGNESLRQDGGMTAHQFLPLFLSFSPRKLCTQTEQLPQNKMNKAQKTLLLQ